MAARVAIRKSRFQRYADLKWPGTSDEHKARAIGVDPASYSRIMNGHQRPGEKFIAAALMAFCDDPRDIGEMFSDLFEVLDDTPEPVAS